MLKSFSEHQQKSFSTCSKFTEWVVRVACGLLQLKKSPSIIHQVLLVLRVHGVHLPVFAALVKQWAEKELSKPAQKGNDMDV